MHAFPAPLALVLAASSTLLTAQPYGPPDRQEPGDRMIQQYLEDAASRLEADFLAGITTAQQWAQVRPQYLAEYFQMLGLDPLPDRTPLQATVTRILDRGDYVVEMLHYQSRPGLYVTGNLYRPAQAVPGQPQPAILYVCGHSGRGRNGNKTAFQSHGIWFARHGYVCLVVDTLQLGEMAGVHHGTYREGRWWWHSRGYTPAGVECWNGMRGIDYLISRPDVDPGRIGVTGISGGGAATFWIAAADERVKAAVPVSGMADLQSYLSHRVINGHCDCMFLYNTFQWPWTRLAALVAPRPLLFVNSDQDSIFPMDANERVINRLERLYSLFGRSDDVDSVVSMGGHAYRQDIRQAAFRFLNTHLKNDPRPVLDSEVDLVTGPREDVHPIPPEQLRVFPTDQDIPREALNARIDQVFVPLANFSLPDTASFGTWRANLLAKIRQWTFHHFPEAIPTARLIDSGPGESFWLETEAPVRVRVQTWTKPQPRPNRVVMYVASSPQGGPLPEWLAEHVQKDANLYVCEPRGTGLSRWTVRNPPNYVERSHALLGRTVDSGRVWDVAACASFLRSRTTNQAPVVVAAEGSSAALAIYAALLEPQIEGLILRQLPASHVDAKTPALLNVLRVADLPPAAGMLAPRNLTLLEPDPQAARTITAIYQAAGATEHLVIR